MTSLQDIIDDSAPSSSLGLYPILGIALVVMILVCGCCYIFCLPASSEPYFANASEEREAQQRAVNAYRNNTNDSNNGALSSMLRDRKAMVEHFLKTNVMTSDWANKLRSYKKLNKYGKGNNNKDQRKGQEGSDTDVISEPPSGSPTIEVDEEKGDNVEQQQSADNDNDDYPQCAICLEPLQVDEAIGISHDTECSHLFHKACITQWLLTHEGCPMCRRDFLVVSTTAETAQP